MLEVSRRSVVAFGAGAVGAIAVGALAAPTAATGLAQTSTLPSFIPAPNAGLPMRSHFAGHEGEVFLAVGDAASVALTLTAIDDIRASRGDDDEHRFSLIFTANDASGPQGIHEITHPTVPAATLFIAPVGAPEQLHVQALISRDA